MAKADVQGYWGAHVLIIRNSGSKNRHPSSTRTGYDGAMARRPTLSPTKIMTFLACSHKYYWTYLDPRGKAMLRAKDYFSFGSSVHLALQRLHDSRDTEVQTPEQAVKAFQQGFIVAGYANPEAAQDALNRGQEIVKRYAAEAIATGVVTKTLFTEKMLRANLGDFDLIGRVDRVDQFEDGVLEIVDYKSKRQSVTSEEVASDLAMGCYQLMLSKAFPEAKIQARIVAVQSGASAVHQMSQEELIQLEGDIKQFAQLIFGYDFETNLPQKHALCEHCDFRPLCSRIPEWSEALESS